MDDDADDAGTDADVVDADGYASAKDAARSSTTRA